MSTPTAACTVAVRTTIVDLSSARPTPTTSILWLHLLALPGGPARDQSRRPVRHLSNAVDELARVRSTVEVRPRLVARPRQRHGARSMFPAWSTTSTPPGVRMAMRAGASAQPSRRARPSRNEGFVNSTPAPWATDGRGPNCGRRRRRVADIGGGASTMGTRSGGGDHPKALPGSARTPGAGWAMTASSRRRPLKHHRRYQGRGPRRHRGQGARPGRPEQHPVPPQQHHRRVEVVPWKGDGIAPQRCTRTTEPRSVGGVDEQRWTRTDEYPTRTVADDAADFDSHPTAQSQGGPPDIAVAQRGQVSSTS